MGKALYRKYRSKKLGEIVGQDHITKTLEQAIKQGKISHAYLFTGPRGVGKTSIARILAHEINQLPYTDDSSHIDIIEIDAASNRRIDEIRELRDKVYVAPTSAAYKVYIIDEVHMLTREAFNALLKTLEEPPAHAVFILATTDAHKLPDTIISRTQRYSFKPVPTDQVAAHLREIATKENITISDEALELLAKHGEGSFRDSISLLDQASSHSDKLEADDIQALLGMPSEETIQELIKLLGNSDAGAVVRQLTQLYDQGFQASAIAAQLGASLRQSIVNNSAKIDHDRLFGLMTSLLDVPTAHQPERYLEITLLGALNSSNSPQTHVDDAPPSPPNKTVRAEKVASDTHSVSSKAKSTITEEETEVRPEPEPISKEPEPTPVSESGSTTAVAEESAASEATLDIISTNLLDESLWPSILQALKKKHNTIYGIVRMAQPNFTDDELQLTFQFAFHQKRMNEAPNRQLLTSVIEELTGKPIKIECHFDKGAKPPKTEANQPHVAPSTAIANISNIFGGGELLES